MLRRISRWVGIAVVGTVIGFSLQFAKAWTEPASAPPAGNVAAPVNVSATAQLKSGALGVSGVFHGYSTGIFDGNVGIGTAAPTGKLHVVQNGNGYNIFENTTAGGTVGLQIKNGAVNNYIGSQGNSLYFYAGDGVTEDMTILNNGNVGIGTATPPNKLHVSGNIGATGWIGAGCEGACESSGGYSIMYGDGRILNTSYIESQGVLYPGRVDVAGMQLSWYLGSHGSYGLYTNTGFYSAGGLYTSGYVQSQGVVYPGRVDVAGIQGSWYLGSSGSYGLYTNTGMYIAGNMWSTGASISGRLTVGEAGGAYTYITLQDDESPNGVKYIHANSNVVGFLSGYGGWLVNWDNSGNMTNTGSINASEIQVTRLVAAGAGCATSERGKIRTCNYGADQGLCACMYSSTYGWGWRNFAMQ